MTSLPVQNGRPSRLPIVTKEKAATGRGGVRRALGDITGLQINCTKASQPQADVKARVTRLAARRLTVTSVVETVDDMEVEMVKEVPEQRIFPVGVEDIDAHDVGNPQLCSEYALEMFAYLRQVEGRGSVRAGHLSGCPTNDKMRSVLVDWLVEVQLQFKLLQETLFGTVDIIDRYLSIEGSTISRSRLQLVGVSAMFLVAKIEEVYAPACSDFVYITDNAYSEEEIKRTEIKILHALQFNLFQPVSLHFLRRFSKAGDVDVLQHSLAKYALEVGLLEYSLVPVAGSEIAAAALFLSLLLLEPEADPATVWTPTLAFYSGYTRDQLLHTASKLAQSIAKISDKGSKLQAVRTKYRGGKFLKVADLPELKGDMMAKLVKMKV